MTQGKKRQREASQCVLRTASGGGVSCGGMHRGGVSCGVENPFAHHCSTSLDLLARKLKLWVNYHHGGLSKSLISRARVGSLEAP